MVEVKITGLAETGKALLALGDAIAQTALRKSTSDAAQDIADDAAARAPVRSGALQEAIGVFRRSSPPLTALYAVGVKKIRLTRKEKVVKRILRRAGKTIGVIGDAYYWRFVEFGTQRQPAQGFMRKAFEAQKLASVEAFTRDMRERLAAAIARAKAQG